MRMSRDERLALVGEQEHSGQTALAFCRQRGIGYQNFLRWKRTLATGLSPERTDKKPAFVELALESSPPGLPASSLAAELVLGSGIVLRVFAPTESRP